MKFDFSEKMKVASDEELIRITTVAKEDYQEEAVLAAQAELNNRNLTFEKMEELKFISISKKEADTIRAGEPLDDHWKALTFIFPLIITFILSGYFKAQGYDKKSKDLVLWTFIGFGFYFALITIISLT